MLRTTLGTLSLALTFGTFVACSNGGETETETDAEVTEEVQGCADDDYSPCVLDGSIYCEFIGGSAKVMTWWVNATAEDPQGAHTIRKFPNWVYAYTAQGEQELMAYTGLVCDEGECIGSFREEDYGLLCDQPDQYVFKAVVQDADDNLSPPYTLPYEEP